MASPENKEIATGGRAVTQIKGGFQEAVASDPKW